MKPGVRIQVRAAVAGLACLWVCLPLRADVDFARLTGESGAEGRLRQIDADLRRSFDSIRAAYAERLARRPYDVVEAVEQCRFLEQFAASYEYLDWLEEAYEFADGCLEELTAEYPDHPEVELLGLERRYGQDQIAAGRELLGRAERQVWTTGQMSRLYSLLARTADQLGMREAGEFAVRALDLDVRADVRLIAATKLIADGARDKAVEVLTSPFDSHPAADGYYVTRKMRLLADLHEGARVRELHAALLEAGDFYGHVDAARAFRDIGAIDLARQELETAKATNTYSNADERERFELEYAYGSAADALAAYTAWRDLGWRQDPVAINRFALLLRDASLPWRPRDWLGLLGAALAIAAIALAAVAPIVPVHYRGLAKRARDGAPYPVEGWSLRHAWLALFAFGLGSYLALYTIGPVDLSATTEAFPGSDATPAQLARMAVDEQLIWLLLLLPLSAAASKRQPSWWGHRWTWRRSLLVGVGVALAFRVPLILLSWLRPEIVSSYMLDNALMQMLAGLREQLGIAAAFWLIAVAAPVMEEFVFRGVLLRAFSSHLAFGWANLSQAAVFAALHQDLKAFPLLFVFGVVAGVIARRSDGLRAPMILHAAFNAVAAIILLT